jgi:biotin carboxyl carrier protein
MGNNEDMLRDLLAEDQNISLLLSHTLTVLNNTIPSSKDKTIHSTLITKFKSNQTTIDSDLVSYSSLLDNWNKLNTSTSSSQESAFIEVQKSKRAYEQALEDYSTANEASKLSSQTANLRIQQASYGLQSARRNSESLSGLAPVSGTISKKYKKIGDEVSSGEAIYEIVDPNGAEIISFVPSSMAKLIKVGTPVLLSEQEYQVTEVASVPTGIGNKYEVRASVDGDKYQIGEYTTANFILTQPTGLWIPLSAIENRNNKSYIYQVDTQGGLSRYEVFIEKFASNQALLRADELLESKQILRYAKGISINTIIDLNGK